MNDIDQLTSSVTGTVYKIAREMATGSTDIEELISDGFLGAVKAARAFEPSRGLAFSTYARHRIRGEMIDGLRRMDYAIRSDRERTTKAWRQAEAEGREFSDNSTAPPVSLDTPIGDQEGNLITIGDIIPDNARPIDDALADLELVNWALAYLQGREDEVIRRMYWNNESQYDIARDWGCSPSRVSQIHHKALHALRVGLLRAGVESVQLNTAVAAIARQRRNSRLDPIERSAMLGNLLAFWGQP